MWNVNIYRAPYNNVTIRYRNVVINEEMGGINFNFDVIDTPDESVYNVENVELQGFAADVLQDIIERQRHLNLRVQMTEINLQQTILRNLLTNDPYTRKVAAFLTPDYFEGTYQSLLKETLKYIGKFNRLPTLEAFKIEIDENDRLPDDQYRHAMEILPDIFTHADEDMDWLVEKTEKFCQDRAVFNAVMESISIIDGKHQTLSKNAIPDVLTKALSVSFDTNIGHDYLENSDARFDFYHLEEERIPFDLDYFNRVTKGGLPNKTLNIALAGTGVGKSLFMCHSAAGALSAGKNVLYLTMEMSEERIAERIDANLLNVPMDQLEHLSKPMFDDRVSRIKGKTEGKLIIKEYPTGSAHANHFRALFNELKLKKQFVPDIIYIDYLNICASARMKGMGGAINSYSYIKSIAEELRGLPWNSTCRSCLQRRRLVLVTLMMTWGWKIRPSLLDYPQPPTSCSHLSPTTNSRRTTRS